MTDVSTTDPEQIFAAAKRDALQAVGLFDSRFATPTGGLYGASALRIGEALLGLAGQSPESLREAARNPEADVTSHVEITASRTNPDRLQIALAEPVTSEHMQALRASINALGGDAVEERGYTRNETNFQTFSVDTRAFHTSIVSSGALADGNRKAHGVTVEEKGADTGLQPQASMQEEIVTFRRTPEISASFMPDLEIVQTAPDPIVVISEKAPVKDMAAIARSIVAGKLDKYKGARIEEVADPMALAESTAWRARFEGAQKGNDVARS